MSAGYHLRLRRKCKRVGGPSRPRFWISASDPVPYDKPGLATPPDVPPYGFREAFLNGIKIEEPKGGEQPMAKSGIPPALPTPTKGKPGSGGVKKGGKK